jgi:hypothetical protein
VRGISKSEESSSANPLLQLFVRSGERLLDIYSGTYRIDCIAEPGADPVAVVSSTPFNTADAPAGSRLGLGRYAITTGSMTTWDLGTYRVICTYVLAAGGVTYTQAFEFELLDGADWPLSGQYVGYLSTRRCYQDGVALSTAVSRASLHREIAAASSRLEQLTGRWFEPRYLELSMSGSGTPVLLLPAPVLAIEALNYTDDDPTNPQLQAYDAGSYQITNRHLDGYAGGGDDDRDSPAIRFFDSAIADMYGTLAPRAFPLPRGQRNIRVVGLFGYTDPDPQAGLDGTSLGRTPVDIETLVGALVKRQRRDKFLTSPSVWAPGSVKSMKTRDQAISMGGVGASALTDGNSMLGDAMLDRLLARFCQPARAAYADDARWWREGVWKRL